MFDDLESEPVSVLVHDTLEECELLLCQAEKDAADLRRCAEEEAARIRHEASAQISQRVAQAAEVADDLTRNASRRAAQIIEAAEVRQAEIEAHIASWRASVEDVAARRMREADVAAAQRRQEAEDEAVAMLQTAWRESVVLQQDLLDEVEAETADMLRRAEADAALLRAGAQRLHAEARRLHDQAEHVRRDADRYATQLWTAALNATREPQPRQSTDAAVGPQPPSGRSSRWSLARRLLPIVLVVLAAVGIRAHISEPYSVTQASMQPTLTEGERVIVNKLSYRFGTPNRGDVVVIGAGDRLSDETIVKRVVGLPGERIEAVDGDIHIDGVVLEERYLDDVSDTPAFGPVAVGAGQVFVLGDNRTASLDSRWFGPVSLEDIVGRAEVVIWPLTGVRLL